MPNLKFSIRNAKQLEASLVIAAKNYANAAFDAIEKELKTLGNNIIRRVESSEEYRKLLTDPTIRGKLGLARQGLKTGSDTDAEDLIKELKSFTVTRRRSFNTRNFSFKMPTLQELESRLTHRLTKNIGGSFAPGRLQSWFRWWEFGDNGEIDTLTLFRRGSAAAARRLGINNMNINQLINARSRSGSALQIISQPADGNSSIVGNNLIGNIYQNFGQIFPAQVGKALRRFTRNNKPNSFFLRVSR